MKLDLVRETFEDPLLPKVKTKKAVNVPGKKKHKRRIADYFVNKETFFQFFNEENDNVIKSLLDFYGIDYQPKLFFRSGENYMYMTNEAIKNIVKASDNNHNIFMAGVKVFEKLNKRNCNIDYTMTTSGRNIF